MGAFLLLYLLDVGHRRVWRRLFFSHLCMIKSYDNIIQIKSFKYFIIMSTISVPLSLELGKSLNDLIKSGYGSNKADVIRRALKKAVEEEAIRELLQSIEQMNSGKVLKGDLRELAKKIK
jgi:Arc/MetJ-type ribon-helix-helix transcriptional regulator